MKSIPTLLTSTLLALALPGQAVAEEDWEFIVSPLFLWGLSIDGDATINGNTAPLDLDFRDDILDNMEMVFTIHGEARKGRWGLMLEYQYVDLEPEVGISQGPVSIEADIGFEEDFFEFAGAYAFSESDTTRWEVLLGGRYTDQKVDVDADIISILPPLPEGVSGSGGDSWWQAIAGIRVQHQLSKQWSFIGRADYGYEDSDNSSYNGAFMFNYRFNDWGSAFIGARYLDYDYEDDDYGFDAAKAGPLAGVSIHF